MLGRWRKGRREQELRDRIARSLVTSPSWAVRVFETDWFCPYCGQVGARARPGHPIIEPIFHHLTAACERYAEAGESSLLPLEEIERRAHVYRVSIGLSNDKAWQTFDETGRWFCPYCGQVGADCGQVVGPMSREQIEGIARHVAGCEPYRLGEPPLDAREVHRRAVQATTVRRLAERVAEMVARHNLWSVADADRCWVCPYCTVPVPGIEFGADRPTPAGAEAIARHLIRSCPAYRNKRAPVKSTVRLRAIALGEPPEGLEADEEVPLLTTITQQFRLSEVELARARMLEEEMTKAQRAQQRMLPDMPVWPGYQVEVLFRPCGHLAGDFYDFVPIDEHRLGIVVGDVSGHGVDAALVMGMVKKVLNMAAREADGPAETLRRTNAEIYRDLPRGMFATVWYGVSDRRERTLNFCRAGHEPSFIFNPTRRPTLLEYRPGGIALGLDSGARFDAALEETEVLLWAGDHLLLYTDGLAETKSPEGDEFGVERIRAVLKKYGAMKPEVLVQKLDLISSNFRKDGPATDDLTVLSVRLET